MAGLWLIIIGFQALFMLAVSVLLFRIILQQGRMLLRLDSIEHRAGFHSVEHPILPLGERFAHPVLSEGDVFPDLALPNLDNRIVALGDFPDSRLLAIVWSATCSFCQQIAAPLSKLQQPLARQGVQILLLADGTESLNKSQAEVYGLRCPILMRDDREPSLTLGGSGTPVAYLVETDRRIASPAAIGSDAVLALASKVARRPSRLPGQRSLEESKLERRGLPVGTPAPWFTLPDLNGRPVSLKDYRGRRVILVFSDPDCGPCNELNGDLVRISQSLDAAKHAIIMVSRRPLQKNIDRAERDRIAFPVVLQEHWKLSREYGIFATPVAFAIDEAGIVAEPVARGTQQIQQLISVFSLEGSRK